MRFARVAECFDQLERTPKRNEMVEHLAGLFREANVSDISQIIYLSQGRVAPSFEQIEFGMGEALVAEALAQVSGQTRDDIRERFAEVGDYGLVAAELRADASDLSAGPDVAAVFEALTAVATAAGSGSVAHKTALLADLLRQASASEAKPLVRIPLGRLRLGIGDPTVMDALSVARTGAKAARKAIERAYNICSDLGLVARTYWQTGDDGLATIRVTVGRPVRPALCERLPSPEAIITKLERCAVEPKIDGFRAQLHQSGSEAHIFSRNLENITDMFPELVEALTKQTAGHRVILEGEAVSYDPETLHYQPFQVTVQRKRKHDIEAMRAQLPLKLLAFDILYLDGVDLTDQPYVERRRCLGNLLGGGQDPNANGDTPERGDDWLPTEWVADPSGPTLIAGDCQIIDNAPDLDAYFHATIAAGQEGIVAKRLDSVYQAGARNSNWIKLKRSYRGELQDTIDCVIVGYWQGKGQRARFGIGTVLTAVYDRARDTYATITRLGTGFSEEEWVALRERLEPLRQPDTPPRVDSVLAPDVWVEPRLVIEVQADEITRSPLHTAGRGGDDAQLGYALRFPRVMGFVREDKRPDDATTVDEIVALYDRQGQHGAKKA